LCWVLVLGWELGTGQRDTEGKTEQQPGRPLGYCFPGPVVARSGQELTGWWLGRYHKGGNSKYFACIESIDQVRQVKLRLLVLTTGLPESFTLLKRAEV
jgi:hypothetical protein